MTAQLDYFDELNSLFPEPKEKIEKSLVEKFAEERLQWGDKLASMTAQMKNLGAVAELMTNIFL